VDYRIYFELLGYRWTQEILTALRDGPLRHTELQHAMAPSPSSKVLTESLGRLLDHGLIQRATGGDAAPYSLTDAGRAFVALVLAFLNDLTRWGEEYAHAH